MHLQGLLKGKVVIVGIGNPLRGDDALGPELIANIRGRCPYVCIDAGSTPENQTGAIIREKPDVVLLIDAVAMEKAPGEYDILSKDEILRKGFSTHDIPVPLFVDYLEEQCGAKIYLLAVQPESIRFGDDMSQAVRSAIDKLAVELSSRSTINDQR